MAPGLGETLASGARGSPWRLNVDKRTGHTTTLAFANFPHALAAAPRPATPVPAGAGRSLYSKPPPPETFRGLFMRRVDYSREPLSADGDARDALGLKLRDVSDAMEGAFGEAQDVEGCVIGGQVYVLQSRPQP